MNVRRSSSSSTIIDLRLPRDITWYTAPGNCMRPRLAMRAGIANDGPLAEPPITQEIFRSASDALRIVRTAARTRYAEIAESAARVHGSLPDTPAPFTITA